MKSLLLLAVASLGLAAIGCDTAAKEDPAAPTTGIKDKTPKDAEAD